MRAIIWAAVSTKPQLKGDSLEAQIRDAQEVCERFGWEVVATLRVPGSSRDFIFFPDAAGEVPAYREFQHLCENSSADVVVCRGRDRLGRTDALIAQVEALAQRSGMQIYSMAMPSAIVEPEKAHQDRGALYAAAIERASAQAEMIELRRRHQMGMRARIRRGLHPSKPPYGYKRNSDSAVAVQVLEEVAIIRKIMQLYLAGWSSKKISAYLNDQGIPSPLHEHWYASAVRRLIHNRFYAGWVYYGDTIAPGKHEPIYSPQEWNMIRNERQRRKQTRGKAAYPYSGLVRCKTCGYSMPSTTCRQTRSSGQLKVYAYYRCREGRDPEQHRSQKHHTMVRVEAVREAILKKVQELHDPEVLDAISRDRAAEERATLEERKAHLEDTLEHLSAEITRLLEAHARWEMIPTAEFDQAIQEANQRRKGLQERLLQADIALQELPDPEIRVAQLRELASDVRPILDSPKVDEANAWLSKRIKAIWCEGNQVLSVELI